MTRFVTIILYIGLVFSRDQEFLYSTLIDTSFENNPFSWTDAVYKIDAQGLNIEYLIPSRSKIEDVSDNQSTILFTSGDSIMIYENGLIDTLNINGLSPRFIFNGDIIFFKNTSEFLFELHRYSFLENSDSVIADSFRTISSFPNTFPYYLSHDKQNLVYLETALSDTIKIKNIDVLSGSQIEILSFPPNRNPWSIYWAYDNFLYFSALDDNNIAQLFRINSSGIDEYATQLTFLENGFSMINSQDRYLNRIVGLENHCSCDIYYECANDLSTYNFESGQILKIGEIEECFMTTYHSWSLDYSKLAVGTMWAWGMPGPGFIKTFNFATADSAVIANWSSEANARFGYGMKFFWAGGQEDMSLSQSTSLPSKFILHQNFPNPFNPITTVRYELPEDSFVDVTIYDMLGNAVNNLVYTNQSSGYKSIQWNATNNHGQPVSTGVYLYSIEAGDFRQTKKMILLK